ncbi:MAG TPA: MauE/DoxX family redox-associated membrane protein [Solirubrobacteraceae bacterium]|jgi:uncharacterized membrane protein YphA (DoxX/SURF4 family)|nr:MauE/DoxX family redox-associated membrane protein [Solirubrobacteraceae bacterium]
MASLVLVFRIALAVIFATAGVAKLSDLQSSRDTVEAFGMPKQLAEYAGSALPVGELAAAVALLITPAAVCGGAAAILLLTVFMIGIAYALNQGRTPDCNCFGQVSSARIGWQTLARNAVLLLVAILVVVQGPGSSLTAWTSNDKAANLVAGLAVLASALLVISTVRYRHLAAGAPNPHLAGTSQGATHGLPVGTQAPDFTLPDLDGEMMSRDALLTAGLPLVLIFASQTCAPCITLMPEVARWTSALGESVALVVVESGVRDREALIQQLKSFRDIRAVIETENEVAASYEARATPTAIAISPDGRIASSPAIGGGAIETLIRSTLRGGAGLQDHDTELNVGSTA